MTGPEHRQSPRRQWVTALTCLAVLSVAAASTESDPLHILRKGFGEKALARTVSVHYHLAVSRPDGSRLREGDYCLEPGTGTLVVRNTADGSLSWISPTGNGVRRNGTNVPLDEATTARLRAHAATHFLRLLRDPATRAQWQDTHRIRLFPAGQDAFDVRLDAHHRIVENRFDDGTVSVEHDYRDIGGIWWPMRFDAMKDGKPVASGLFSNLRLETTACERP
ncbi:hypothetical protein [Tahibacter amnicola]|uniref:Group 4 capsule polysaccharide lipoprotein GfcB/YjbF n=1 Tax=Tahibacter amnicola TaxID=2976241 RepID=A0ABY6BK79_9GAMM|nr:hypothetical protein [Tahibacter amnicola]UXI70179.1 hypothetical protein N4264_11270 [Tahibacter amnicola]